MIKETVHNHLFCSSNVTGPGMVEEATESSTVYQCFPLFTMLLALGNPRYTSPCYMDLGNPSYFTMLLALGNHR